MMSARLSLLAACASAGLAACAGSAAPGPRPEPGGANPPAAANATYAYYDVTGTTVAELRTAMRQLGPPEGFGRTRWDLSWTARWQPVAGGCRVTSAVVTLRSEVRLPRWEPGPDADAALVAQWRTFMENLRVHEHGHLEIAVAAVHEAERTLWRLEAPSCRIMQGAANQAAERVLATFRARDRAYDTRTRHGFTQGAAWPLPS